MSVSVDVILRVSQNTLRFLQLFVQLSYRSAFVQLQLRSYFFNVFVEVSRHLPYIWWTFPPLINVASLSKLRQINAFIRRNMVRYFRILNQEYHTTTKVNKIKLSHCWLKCTFICELLFVLLMGLRKYDISLRVCFSLFQRSLFNANNILNVLSIKTKQR